MYEHFLVPTDGSALSVESVNRAVKFAKRLGARITFFYFAEDPSKSIFGDAALLYSMAPAMYAAKYEWRQKAVLWKAEAEALAMGVPFQSVTASKGGVAEALLQAAAEQGCDMIFMASHGGRGAVRMMLGSVTLKVLINSPIPIHVSETGKNSVTAMSRAINIIREEHRSLSAVLRGLTYLLEQAQAARKLPDLAIIRAILSYLVEFSQEFHHPKEEDYLFRKLRAKTGEFDGQLDALCSQHVQEPQLIEELKAAVSAAEQSASSDPSEILAAVERLVTHVRKHMGMEESLLMPAACRLLDESDWQEIEKAFLDNGDPRFGAESDEEFRLLFARIVNLFPTAKELVVTSSQ
jgi:nucleotide-binding universal stress UspA family protein/hemerythrin-like domain-containing protein